VRSNLAKSGFWIALTAATLAAGLAFAQAAAPGKVAETPKGKMLTDAQGMTLYIFDKDPKGKSACNGLCADNWRPMPAVAGAAASGDWSLVAREDGSKQWAYKAKALYTWAQDRKPGDTNGDGVNNSWHIAKP
jgi:predicted lipoprotein with Yx(FWY)xxD motif